MITCDKGNVEMKGNLILLEAETAVILREIRNTIEEVWGKNMQKNPCKKYLNYPQ